jgi:hypothetical protein
VNAIRLMTARVWNFWIEGQFWGSRGPDGPLNDTVMVEGGFLGRCLIVRGLEEGLRSLTSPRTLEARVDVAALGCCGGCAGSG